MIFDSAENKCILETLKILEKKNSKYGIFFKETKFSHTTLQNVLNDLIKDNFVKKTIIDKLTTDYEITDKGRKFLKKLEELSLLV